MNFRLILLTFELNVLFFITLKLNAKLCSKYRDRVQYFSR